MEQPLLPHHTVDHTNHNLPEAPASGIVPTIKLILKLSKLNYLLIFVPLGIIAHFQHLSPTAVFTLNFFAIIPLAKLLGFATEEISLYLGETVGGLLNATFGNAVELIVSVIALNQNMLRVVQTSLLGSILANLLLVTGFCFLCGGLKFNSQRFNMTAAQTFASLLALTLLSLMLPAAFYSTMPPSDKLDSSIINLSRASAIVLLFIYCSYLTFQLRTHTHLFKQTPNSRSYMRKHSHLSYDIPSNDSTEVDIPALSDLAPSESPKISKSTAMLLMVVVTLTVSFCADYMVESIEGLTEALNLSEAFVGFILLPIVANAAEHVSAVTFAMKDKMDLALGIAIGSSMQIALFLIPVLVLCGWIMAKPLTLFFHTFETATLFISVLVVNYLIMDGESNWLEGIMLLATYTIVALAFFFYPQF